MGLTGGCMCGAVRYQIDSQPGDCGWCHCRTCQLFGGAPALAFASVPANDFTWTSKQPQWVETSTFGRRAFCAECGTPLQVQVNYQPETVDFPITTLDDPSVAEPEFHIFWASRVRWFNPSDDLPKHDRFRPDTRGLAGTEPPDDSALAGGA